MTQSSGPERELRPPARLTPPPRPKDSPLLPPRRSGERGGPSPAALVVVSVLFAAALFVVFGLPRWAERRAKEASAQTVVDGSEREAAQESPAVVEETPVAVEPEPAPRDPPPVSGSNEVAQALARGNRALSENDGYAAALAFRRVLELEPDHVEAARGLERAKRLDELRGLLADAAEAEQLGRDSVARAAWQDALKLDPGATEARQGLARLANRNQARAFSEAMSEALAALESDQLESALSALKRAEAVGHDPAEVAELRTEIANRARDLQIAERARGAADLEQKEEWPQALDLYGELLEMDSTLALAQDGLKRSASRAKLDARLESHLAGPARLANDAVLEDARSALALARDVESPGPRLASQIDRLDRLVAEVSVPVPVVIESDAQTEVAVYQVGRLGRFDRHQLELRPGKYTVVGTRDGFRDVRLSLVVRAGEPTSLVVRCTEAI